MGVHPPFLVCAKKRLAENAENLNTFLTLGSDGKVGDSIKVKCGKAQLKQIKPINHSVHEFCNLAEQ